MPLFSMKELLADALQRGYALCYCEAWNLESLQAELEAAEELDSPAIIGFNGGSLMHPPRSRPENLSFYAGFVLSAHRSRVPISFLLNETDSLTQIREAMELGFNAIMVDEEHLAGHKYREMVKRVVSMAHSRDVAVEAQFGRLPFGAETNRHDAWETDPLKALAFIEETGIDALSVAVGNTHILTRGKSPLDLDVLERIHAEVELPLVLHGGTGIPTELAPEIIRLGVAKLNFGTGLKQAYLAAVQEKLSAYQQPKNPHPFLGWGGERDIMVAGYEAVKEKVKALLRTFGSEGKAESLRMRTLSARS